MDQPESKFMPVGAVAAALQVSTSQVAELVSRHEFPEPHDLGGGVRHWHKDDLTAWLADVGG